MSKRAVRAVCPHASQHFSIKGKNKTKQSKDAPVFFLSYYVHGVATSLKSVCLIHFSYEST